MLPDYCFCKKGFVPSAFEVSNFSFYISTFYIHLMIVNLKDVKWLGSESLPHTIRKLLNLLSSFKFSCKAICHSMMSITMLSYTCSLYCNQSVTWTGKLLYFMDLLCLSQQQVCLFLNVSATLLPQEKKLFSLCTVRCFEFNNVFEP